MHEYIANDLKHINVIKIILLTTEIQRKNNNIYTFEQESVK